MKPAVLQRVSSCRGMRDPPDTTSIWCSRETSSNVLDVSPRGRNGRQADGSSTQPQAGRSRELIPLPDREPSATPVATETELEPAPQGARVGAPLRSKRDHAPAALRADRGFDAQARTRVSLNSCLGRKARHTDTSPDDELDERFAGARPNL